MITLLLLCIGVPVVYLTGWAFMSRALFRAWRIHEAEKKSSCPNPGLQQEEHDKVCTQCSNNVLWWEKPGSSYAAGIYSNNQLAGFAALQAAAWPIAGPVRLACRFSYRFITANAPLSPSEIKARQEADAVKIAELEHQLDAALNGDTPA